MTRPDLPKYLNFPDNKEILDQIHKYLLAEDFYINV